MSRPPLRFALASAFLACAGCSGSPATSPGTFGDEPLTSVMSDSGALHADVRSSPQPPTLGNGSWSYTMTDSATGKPAAGLTLSVVPWMPSMGHGTSIVPSVTDEGGGLYVIDDVDLFMPGQWDLRTAITGSETDKLVVSVDVP
jgi:hypothetical protein